MSDQRTGEFQRNTKLEQILREVNELIGAADGEVIRQYTAPETPVVLVIGAPRSGTTLMMQWLAATGAFSYPTNLLSRFYSAPYLGARIQQVLTDPVCAHGRELFDLSGEVAFASRLGKTEGALSPNEWWYWWRRYTPNSELRWLTPEEESAVDAARLARDMAALEAVFGKPFAAKGMILQYNLQTLLAALPKVIFLHIRRDPFYAAQSILQARERFYGTRDTWYSVKPRAFEWLKDCDCCAQVAGQVLCTVRDIEQQFAAMAPAHHLTVEYEKFCGNPAQTYADLSERFESQNASALPAYAGPGHFDSSNAVRLDDETRTQLECALAEIRTRCAGQ